MTVKNQILDIIREFSPEKKELPTENEINKHLFAIMSHSQQAILFVSTLEDEFEIEIDDEEINLDTFLNFNNIVDLINRYLT